VKVGAENKTQVRAVIALMVILVLVGIYSFKDFIWGSSAAAPPASATTQPKNASGGIPAQDSSDPRLRTDILDASRKVKYEAGNRNPFAMGAPPIPPIDASVRTGPTPTPPPPTPTPLPRIPIKYYGLVSKPGEPKRVFLQPEGKEQEYIVGQGEIVDRRYRVVQIQPTSVVLEDVLTGNRQPIQVEPPPQPGGR
jgi:hypothetical protein